MFKSVSTQEVERAKYAAVGFILTTFLEKKEGTPEYRKYLKLIGEFADLDNVPGGRQGGGINIDYYAPSFWHACCSVLRHWVHSRLEMNEKKATIMAYRGQANPWPFCPTLWRSAYPDLGSLPIEAIRKYLQPGENSWDKDESFTFFPGYTTIDGLTAFAQHHEFPTRFLDLTFHPMVALYFATRTSDRGNIPGHMMNGHGVIYDTYFSNLQLLTENTAFKLELGMAPPAHVPRLYQQQGFFVDCGDVNNKQHLAELESIFMRTYFPRTYPQVDGDIQKVFSDQNLIIALGNKVDVFASPQIESVERNWYIAFGWYVKAIEALKEYCITNRANFDVDKAVAIMKASNDNKPLPWGSFGAARSMFGIEATMHLARAAMQVYNLAAIYNSEKFFLQKELTLAYAKANPALLEAIIEVAKKIELFDIEFYAGEISAVEGVLDIITGSLTPEDRALLDSFSEARYG